MCINNKVRILTCLTIVHAVYSRVIFLFSGECKYACRAVIHFDYLTMSRVDTNSEMSNLTAIWRSWAQFKKTSGKEGAHLKTPNDISAYDPNP